MEEKTWGCLKQTAIGCGLLIVLAIAFPIVMGLMVMSPFNRAIDARLSIEERFGPQDAYVPPSSGAPSADRIEVFLEIRRSLAGPCVDLTAAERQVEKMESYDHEDSVDRVEVIKEAFSLTKSMMGIGPVMGRLYEIRNQSLLDAGMGLGEFTYIFVVAYADRLPATSDSNRLFGPAPTNRRIRRALRSMLQNQLEALQSQGGGEAEIAALEAEIAAMEVDEDRLPWRDGMPSTIEDALAPYRAELDELYCPAMAPLELMINEKHGPAVESL